MNSALLSRTKSHDGSAFTQYVWFLKNNVLHFRFFSIVTAWKYWNLLYLFSVWNKTHGSVSLNEKKICFQINETIMNFNSSKCSHIWSECTLTWQTRENYFLLSRKIQSSSKEKMPYTFIYFQEKNNPLSSFEKNDN